MSISGLSNHLCVVVTTIISLLVAPSTFHQARASSHGSHDFTESRQFKKNLAVSKYRDNVHWLPNYVFKPPEKFNGPRKRPKWEMETTTESRGSWSKQQKLEKWEKKMRDVSNREREKWKNYKAQENLESKTSEKILNRTNEKFDSDENSSTTASDEWVNNLHNGRWGMSVENPPTIEEFQTDSPKWLGKKNPLPNEATTTKLPEIIPNGRWGMSVKEVPTNFIKEISKSQKEYIKEVSTDFPKSLESVNSKSQSNEELAATISNGRWGMNVKEAPKEFLNEMSRRSQTLAISDRVWKQDEDPKSMGNRKMDAGLKVRVKEVSVAEGPVETNLPKVFPSGRWGMSSDLPPREFLREISRRGLSGIPEFYKSTTVHHRAHRIAKNNPQSRELMFSQISGIPNILFPRLFPRLIRLPTCPIYFLIIPKFLPIASNYNCRLLSHILNQRKCL